MRPVAIVGSAQLPSLRRDVEREEAELVQPVVTEALASSGLERSDIGFTCSGSSDYLVGRPFSFVAALDGVAPWPPISESHVEMDAAWALYEAWVRLQHGDIDAALVYGFGKSSLGDVREIGVHQLDPYYLAPLGLDTVSAAALQARVALDRGVCTERAMAEVAVRSRADAKANEFAQLVGDFDVDGLLDEPYLVSPLRRHDCPPISDGAVAVVLAAGDAVGRGTDRPAWIRGMDHRIEAHGLGMRDLAASPSTARAGVEAGVGDGPVHIAELHAPFTHQEIILAHELGLGPDVGINPSGGALAAHPIMAVGLLRFVEAARRLNPGERGVAHATSGPCLQHNLVGVLEVES